MISFRPSINGVFGLLVLAGTPFLFGANNPVKVESLSTPSETVPYQAPIEDEPAAPQMQGIETQYQLQILQQEVQELRGLVEEMGYQLKRMQATQEDRYLELDSRFQNLQSQVGNGARVAPVDPALSDDLTEVAGQTAPAAPTGQSERALYETALELIRNRQFDLAITQLQAVITQYPDGDFIANAYYWLGEVYAAKPDPDYEKARQALAQVITFFPNNGKVPDAAFKLGKVYHLMGDCTRAREVLSQVVKDHQGKSAAKLAENYLRDKVGNCQ